MPKENRPPLKTAGYIKQQFAEIPDDWEVDFSGLDFYRVKARGPKLAQVEFDQAVHRLADGRVVIDDIT